jgi:RHS repeat-associated protein
MTITLHHNGDITAPLLAADKAIYDLLGRDQEDDRCIAISGTSCTSWQMLKQTSYTPTGKVQTTTDGAGDQTTFAYDPMDRTLIVTDPVGRRVANVFDAAGQALFTWHGWNSNVPPTSAAAWPPSGGYTGSGPVRYSSNVYGGDGELLSVTDANNNTSTFVYDGFIRLAQANYPKPALGANQSDPADFEFYTYYATSLRKTVQKRDGQIITYTYDNLNRQLEKDLPGTTSGDIYSTYDAAGRPATEYFGSKTSGNGVSYAYDTAGRLTSETQFGRAMSYQLDKSSNRSRTMWPDGNYINYDFDALNRVSQIRENGATSGSGVLAVYAYDPMSRRQSLTRGNGTITSYGYDLTSRLNSLTQDVLGTAQDLNVTMQYTLASELHARTSDNALYDALPVASSAVYVPDGLNRYASVAGVAYAYDARGNMTSDGTNTYTYDVENHLISATGPTPVTLTHDPVGRLQQTTSGALTTQYLYEGTNLVAEYDGSGNLLRRYVHGPDTNEPIVWYEGSTLATRSYLHADERGSIVSTTDSTGAASVYTYGPYGETSTWTGSRFRYTGQTTIPEAHLYYYRARVYSPSLGRFLQTDPIGTKDDLNLYSYTHDDPMNGTDPTGLRWVDVYIWHVSLPSVGHVMVTEHGSTNVILSQFPNGNNASLLRQFDDTWDRENRAPYSVWKIYVSDDKAFDEEVRMQRGLAWRPNTIFDSTQCSIATIRSLEAGGVKLTTNTDGTLIPNTLDADIARNANRDGNKIEKIASQSMPNFITSAMSDAASAKGYESIRQNSDGSITATGIPTGTRIPVTVTCSAESGCH